MNTDPGKSAQFCGCDQGANHVCERHREDAMKDTVPAWGTVRKPFTHEQVLTRPTNPAPREAIDACYDRVLPQTYVDEQVKSWTPTDPGPTRPQLPTDAKARKEYPIFSGVLAYFPDAIAEVAHVSYLGNQQHNPGEPLHWARTKSMDQEDTIARHLMQSGVKDSDGVRHSAKLAWRALALLQLEIEREREMQ